LNASVLISVTEGAAKIAVALHPPTHHTITHNIGAAKIAVALSSNETVTSVDLGYNYIGDEG